MPVPSSLALTNIADGSTAVAADHRNNFTAIQTAVNAIIGFLAAGSTGALLRYDGTNWAKTANVLIDDTNSKITLGALADTDIYRSAAGQLRTDGSFFIGASVTQTTGTTLNIGAGAASVATPATGFTIWCDNTGVLKAKGSGGTITTLALA